MDKLIALLMDRYGLSEQSAKRMASYMTYSRNLEYADDPDVATAQDAARGGLELQKDQIAYGLIPGPTPSPQPTPMDAFNQGVSQGQYALDPLHRFFISRTRPGTNEDNIRAALNAKPFAMDLNSVAVRNAPSLKMDESSIRVKTKK